MYYEQNETKVFMTRFLSIRYLSFQTWDFLVQRVKYNIKQVPDPQKLFTEDK